MLNETAYAVTEFTPIKAFLGGMLIGLSALLLMMTHGRIAGIRLGLPLTAAVTGIAPKVQVDAPLIAMLMAGLLVGYGTVSGSGCTSGHGICGISRLSARSMVATATFLGTAIVMTFLIRHVFN